MASTCGAQGEVRWYECDCSTSSGQNRDERAAVVCLGVVSLVGDDFFLAGTDRLPPFSFHPRQLRVLSFA